jgi:NADH-quinone oxidoreductase subunit H
MFLESLGAFLTHPLTLVVIKALIVVGVMLQISPLLLWLERKGSAYMQDRNGPNRADIFGIRAAGLIHAIVDVIKLLTKEDVVPEHVYKPFWRAAPVVAVTIAFSTMIVVPWGDTLQVNDQLAVPLQGAVINGGVLYILALTSLGVYGVMLAGWASNNKFSLLGGLRSASQMVSYELAMGLSLVVMLIAYGTLDLGEIARQQSGAIWNWGVFKGAGIGFVAFLVFWVALFAETNRMPFDLPEAEAELVAGYHIEYSSLRFVSFYVAEFGNMITASAVTATLFFGGYNFPFLDGDWFRGNLGLVVLLVGLGGAGVFAAASQIAWGRRTGRFYQALKTGDARLREPKFWRVVWAALAAAHLGLAALGAAMTFGGLALPVLLVEVVVAVIGLNILVGKIMIGCWIMVWVRWTVPRFRYDQLMDIGWKVLLPISMVLVFAMGLFEVILYQITA